MDFADLNNLKVNDDSGVHWLAEETVYIILGLLITLFIARNGAREAAGGVNYSVFITRLYRSFMNLSRGCNNKHIFAPSCVSKCNESSGLSETRSLQQPAIALQPSLV